MKTTISNIDGVTVTWDGKKLEWIAGMAIDADGFDIHLNFHS